MKSLTRYVDCVKAHIEFRVGENAQDNFDLIDQSKSDDIWFHIQNHSSCHVVLVLPEELSINKKQLGKIIIQGACICKQMSRYNSAKNVEIIYTAIKNVTKTGIIGTVSTTNTKTVII